MNKEDIVGRRIIIAILIILVVAAVATAIGVGAYHAGYNNGLLDSGHVTRVVPDGGVWYGYHGFGFFPGFFLFPLILVLIFALVFWRRPRHWGYWGCRGGGPGGWTHSGPHQAFDEWHSQAHGGQTQPVPPAPPAADAPQSRPDVSQGQAGGQGGEKAA